MRVLPYILVFLFVWACKPKQTVEIRPEYIQDEFIIELSETGEMSSLEEEYARYDFKQKTKLAPRRELYLVTYDMQKIKPEKMYLKLKENPQVQTLEFNKGTSPRGGRR